MVVVMMMVPEIEELEPGSAVTWVTSSTHGCVGVRLFLAIGNRRLSCRHAHCCPALAVVSRLW
jgi:hypothetical protein